MTEQLLATISGIILSLGFEYIPKFNDWYNALVDSKQKLIMLGALLLASGGVFALACLGRSDLVTCDINGVWKLAELFILATIANQTTHRLSP